MSYLLSVIDGKVRISALGWPKAQDPRIVTSVEDFDQFMASEAQRLGADLNDLRVSVSSTMDFPEEYTSDPETLALVKALRDPDTLKNAGL